MSKIIDMHCDTLLEAWRRKEESIFDGNFSINLKLLKENHSMAQFFAIYLSRIEMEKMDSFQLLKEIHSYYENMLETYSHIIKPAYRVSHILNNHAEGKLSSILTIEDGVFLDGDMSRLYQVYDMGVRLITLLWNFENSVGYPNSMNQVQHMLGLKPFGIEVLEEMNRLGIVIDVSHMSEGGFYDVARYSKRPFFASHSCARSLCNHQRNLTDHQLKTLGNAGGIVGINFEKSFLKEGSDKATFDQIIAHLCYIKNKAGIETVGFGSDFDGIEDNGQLENYSGYSTLLEKMNTTFTYDEIDKICYQNALRALENVIG